ncbi:probable glutamyl-tRNA(Gln) amidotransferase subunit C, chloroplastic [Coccomyxa sp. Obi]|nr:probable glutamyl-tRNA(Gln) amidotransferase subunit C, chloroplastic [Coccomyxa sp. Obi]
MAHISVTDEEVKEWEPQLQQIVSWFNQLQAVDVEGVPPAVRIDMEGENVLRPDKPVQYEAREAILSQVPETEGEFVKVPKIL